MNRREFLKGQAGMAMAGLAINPARTWSRPTKLKITDIRGCTVASNFDYPIIKVYTNQDIYGLGEVRDAGYLGQALILKPYLVGKDPLDIEGIMEGLRPYARDGRFGGGFSGVDMALFDIAGKVLGVPAYKILGEKVRDKIPVYGDTNASQDPKVYAKRAKIRVEKWGLKHLKMDLVPQLIRNQAGCVREWSPDGQRARLLGRVRGGGAGRDRLRGVFGRGPLRPDDGGIGHSPGRGDGQAPPQARVHRGRDSLSAPPTPSR